MFRFNSPPALFLREGGQKINLSSLVLLACVLGQEWEERTYFLILSLFIFYLRAEQDCKDRQREELLSRSRERRLMRKVVELGWEPVPSCR